MVVIWLSLWFVAGIVAYDLGTAALRELLFYLSCRKLDLTDRRRFELICRERGERAAWDDRLGVGIVADSKAQLD